MDKTFNQYDFLTSAQIKDKLKKSHGVSTDFMTTGAMLMALANKISEDDFLAFCGELEESISSAAMR